MGLILRLGGVYETRGDSPETIVHLSLRAKCNTGLVPMLFYLLTVKPPLLHCSLNAQTPGAINIDISDDIQSGIRADATKQPFKDGPPGELTATNPYMRPGGKMLDFLPEATRVVAPGAKTYINGAKINRATKNIKVHLTAHHQNGPDTGNLLDACFGCRRLAIV